jgi:hypothetical protein
VKKEEEKEEKEEEEGEESHICGTKQKHRAGST